MGDGWLYLDLSKFRHSKLSNFHIMVFFFKLLKNILRTFDAEKQ